MKNEYIGGLLYLITTFFVIGLIIVLYFGIMSLIPCDWLANVPLQNLPVRCIHSLGFPENSIAKIQYLNYHLVALSLQSI